MKLPIYKQNTKRRAGAPFLDRTTTPFLYFFSSTFGDMRRKGASKKEAAALFLIKEQPYFDFIHFF